MRVVSEHKSPSRDRKFGKDTPKDIKTEAEAKQLKAFGSTVTKQQYSSSLNVLETEEEKVQPQKAKTSIEAENAQQSQLATNANAILGSVQEKVEKTTTYNQMVIQEKSPELSIIPQNLLKERPEKSLMTKGEALKKNTAVEEGSEALLSLINQQVHLPITRPNEEHKQDIKDTKIEKQLNKQTKEKRRVRFQEETERKDPIQISGNKRRSGIEENVNTSASATRIEPEETGREQYQKLQNTIFIQQNFIEGQLDKIENQTSKSEIDKQSKFHEKEPVEEPQRKEEIKMFGEESDAKSVNLLENEPATTTAEQLPQDVGFTEKSEVLELEKQNKIGKKQTGNEVDGIFILENSGLGSENLEIVNLREAKIDDEFYDLEEDKEHREAQFKHESSWEAQEPKKHEILHIEKKITQAAEKMEESSRTTRTMPEIESLTSGTEVSIIENNCGKLEYKNIKDTTIPASRDIKDIIHNNLQKIKISEPTSKVSKTPEIKLKKSTKFKREPEPKFPNLRLKSRIITIEFPSPKEKLQISKVSFIEAIRENGILSRNIEEAKSVARKPIRRLDDVESPDIEFENIKAEIEGKKIKHKNADLKIMNKKEAITIPTGVEQESLKIVLGKGKIIENEEANETINLRKVNKEKEERNFEASAIEKYNLQATQLETQPYEEIKISPVDFKSDAARPKIASLKEPSIQEKPLHIPVNKEKLVFGDEEVTRAQIKPEEVNQPEIASLKEHSIQEKPLPRPVSKEKLIVEDEEVALKRAQIKPEEINQPKIISLQPFEKSQIEDESTETEIQFKKMYPSKEVTNELSIQRLKPVRKYSQLEDGTEFNEEEIPCVTFKPKITKNIEEINQEFKITLFPYVEEEISLTSKIKLKKPGRQPTFEEESIEESITIVEELDAASGIEAIDNEKKFNVSIVQHEKLKEVSFNLKKPYEINDFHDVAIDIKTQPKGRQLGAMPETAFLNICKEEDTFIDEAVCGDFYTSELQEMSQSQPIFIKRFEDQHNIEGTVLTLKAKVIGFPIPDIKWFRNDQLLEPSDRIFMHREGEAIEFTIKETNSELDTGVYKCLAKNSIGEVFLDAFVLVEIDNVEYTKHLQKSYTAFERETIQLECETSHSVRTKWWFNETEISGMDHRAVIHDGRTHKLVIKNISKNDEGKYKCTVKNQNTMAVLNVIQGKLEFVKCLEDLEITEKNIAILEVEINSDSADVVWFKDGNIIKDTDDKFKTEKQKGFRKLLIGPVSIQDEGEYTCKLMELECEADITVIELPPEILTPLKDETVAKGEKAVFEIKLSKGDAMVKWYKDGKEIQFSEHIQLLIDGKIQKLKIFNCEMEDHGTYSCNVSEQTCSAVLNVYLPSCFWIKPLPEETIVPISADAEFEVKLSKDVDLTWWRRELEIVSSSKYIISNNKLVVKAVDFEDQDVYTCKVKSFNIKTSSKLKVTDNAISLRSSLEPVIADESQLGEKVPSEKYQNRDPASMSEVTTSWLKENSMEADINSYQRSKLLPKDEYFFKIWCYVAKLFK